ncbi:hypothetical protein HDU96_009027 [Phlyctochytrium bullatum]|nr:hypothetical protein HDU96_009027 [Phlyctochytrium bullatum]
MTVMPTATATRFPRLYATHPSDSDDRVEKYLELDLMSSTVAALDLDCVQAVSKLLRQHAGSFDAKPMIMAWKQVLLRFIPQDQVCFWIAGLHTLKQSDAPEDADSLLLCVDDQIVLAGKADADIANTAIQFTKDFDSTPSLRNLVKGSGNGVLDLKLSLLLLQVKLGEEGALKLRWTADLFPQGYGSAILIMFSQVLLEISGQVAPSRNSLLLSISSQTPERLTTDTCFLLHSLFEKQADANPSAIAIEFLEDLTEPVTSMTYAQVETLSNQLARYLREQIEQKAPSSALVPDDIIPVYMPQSPSFYVSTLAVLKAGGAFLPLSEDMPLDRVEFILNDANAKAVITLSHLATPLVNNLQARGINTAVIALDAEIDAIHAMEASRITETASLSSLAYVQYTSGSTGRPKGVMIEHGSITDSVLAHRQYLKWNERSKFLQFANVTFDVSIFEIFFPWAVGICLCGAKRDALLSNLEGFINKLGVTHMELTPTVASLLSPERLPRVQTLITIGEMLTQKVVDVWSPGRHLQAAYGPTEAAVHVSLTHPLSPLSKPSNLGVPLSTCSWYVMPLEPASLDNMEPVPIGCLGELCLGGSNVGRGYLNREEETRKAFIFTQNYGKIYRTGDLARMLPDGSLDILGRINDDQVKLNGQRMELQEVTKVIESVQMFDEVITIVVKAASEVTKRDTLVTFAVPKDATKSDSEIFAGKAVYMGKNVEELERICRDMASTRLPAYMVPSYFVFLDSLPRLPSGKTDKKLLIAVFRDSFSGLHTLRSATNFGEAKAQPTPWSPSELSVGRAISKLTDVPMDFNDNSPSLYRDRSLAEYGIDSLMAVRLCSMLRGEGLSIPVSVLIQEATISSIARKVEPISKIDSASVDCEDASDSLFTRLKDSVSFENVEAVYPCSDIQEAIIAETFKSPDGRRYYNANVLSIECGDANTAAVVEHVEMALKLLVASNDVLRTGFIPANALADKPKLFSDVTYFQMVYSRGQPPKFKVIADLKGDEIAEFLETLSQQEGRMTLDNMHVPPISFSLIVPTDSSTLNLCIVAHHAIYDGWSLELLAQDIATHLASSHSPPSILRPSYRNLIKYNLVNPVPDASVQFWANYLKGINTFASFPSLLGSPSEDGGRSAMLQVDTPITSGEYEARCKAWGVSPQVPLQWIWSRLLRWYTGTSDVIFGVVLSGRILDVEQATEIMGPFLTTLPCRVYVTAENDFNQLAVIHSSNSVITQHSRVSLRKIAAATSKGRAIFDSAVVYQKHDNAFRSANQRVTVVRSDDDLEYSAFLEMLPGETPESKISFRLRFKVAVISRPFADVILRTASHLLSHDLFQAKPYLSSLPSNLVSYSSSEGCRDQALALLGKVSSQAQGASIVDRDMSMTLPLGAIGEVALLVDNESKTHDLGSVIRTGYLGRMLPDGSLNLYGKLEDQVLYNGAVISLDMVVSDIHSVYLSKAACIVVRNRRRNADDLVCFLEDVEVSVMQIIEEMQDGKLSLRVVPDYVLPIARIPIDSATGKADYKTLQTIFNGMDRKLVRPFAVKEANITDITDCAFDHSLVATVSHAISAVAGIPIHDVQLDSNIYQLGLDSISAMQLVWKLKTQKIELSVSDVLSHSTVYSLCSLISERLLIDKPKRDDESMVARTEKDFKRLEDRLMKAAIIGDDVLEAFPCSPLQEGMLAETVAAGDGPHQINWNYTVLECNGRVDSAAATKAWEDLLFANPILRTSFIFVPEEENTPFVQVVKKNAFTPLEYFEVETTKEAEEFLQELKLFNRYYVEGKEKKLQSVAEHGLEFKQVVAKMIQEGSKDDANYVLRCTFNPDVIDVDFAKEILAQIDLLLNVLKDCPTSAPLHTLTTCFSQKLTTQKSTAREDTSNSSEKIMQYPFASQLATTWVAKSKLKQQEDLLQGHVERIDQRVKTLEQRMRLTLLLDDIEAIYPCTPTQAAMIAHTEQDPSSYFNAFVFKLRSPVDIGSQSSETLWDEIDGINNVEYGIAVEFEPTELNQLLLRISAKSSILSDSQTAVILDQVEALFLDVLSHPDEPMQDFWRRLPLGTLSINNKDAAPLKEPDNIRLAQSWFEQFAHNDPNAIALEFSKSLLASDLRRFSYQKLNSLANKVANRLLAAGLDIEDKVPVCIDRSVEMYAAILGVLKAGGVYVPIDTNNPLDRKLMIMRDVHAKFVLTSTSDDMQDLLDHLPNSVHPFFVDDLIKQDISEATPNVNLQPNHLAYILYTSGTTGTPKGVLIENNLLKDLEFVINYFKITHVDLTPSVASLVQRSKVPSVELLWGDGRSLINAFGPSEVTIGCTMLVGVSEDTKPGNIGTPFSNVSAWIMSSENTPVLSGAAGELWVGGPLVGRGYLNRPEQTSRSFNLLEGFGLKVPQKVYRTGDMARMHADGTIEYLGRSDDQVKIRGMRINLSEINSVATQAHDNISTAHTLVLENRADRVASKQLITFVVGAPCTGKTEYDATRIIQAASNACRSKLPSFMVPASVLFIPKLPLGRTGKVDIHALHDIYYENRDMAQVPDKILTQEWTESQLVVLGSIAEVCGVAVAAIRKEMSIFELGIDSLTATHLMRKLRTAGVDIEVSELLVHNRIEDLLAFTSGQRKANGIIRQEASLISFKRRALQVLEHSPEDYFSGSLSNIDSVYPCTPLQKGIVYQTLLTNGSAYCNRFNIRLKPSTDIVKLQDAWRYVINEHEILRSRFVVLPTEESVAQLIVKRSDFFIEVKFLRYDSDAFTLQALSSYTDAATLTEPVKLAVLTSLESGLKYLVLNLHHAVYDASFRKKLPSQVNDNSKFFQFANIAFDVSLYEIWIPWSEGKTLCSAPSDIMLRELEQAIDSLKLTAIGLSPTLASLIRRRNVPSVELLLCGGESLTQKIISEWGGSDGALCNCYGPSECAVNCLLHVNIEANVHPAVIGFPQETCSLFVMNEDMEPVLKGGIGELCVGGYQIARGYWKRPDLTETKFRTVIVGNYKDRVFLTGDLVRMLPDGSIFFVGRKDDQVKKNGLRIELGEINAVIEKAHGDISGVASVVGRHRNLERDQIVSFITLKTTDPKLPLDAFCTLIGKDGTSRGLHQALQEAYGGLPSYMVPNFAFIIPRIPIGATGKTDKKRLLSMYENLPIEDILLSKDVSDSFEWTKRAICIRKALSQVTSVSESKITPTTSFFQIGLDSINAIRLVSILKEMKVATTVLDVMRNSTIAALAMASPETLPENHNFLSAKKYEDAVLAQIGDFAGRGLEIEAIYPCTPLQEGLIAKTLAAGPPTYINSIVFKLADECNIEQALSAWSQLIRRNQILRTSFIPLRSSIAQIVHKSFCIIRNVSGNDLRAAVTEATSLLNIADWKQVPLQLTRFQTAESTYLIIAIHHALYDGFSLNMIIDDFGKLYEGEDEDILRPQFKSVAGWAYLLSLYTQEKDILFGTLLSGRTLPVDDIESIMGPTFNTVIVRLNIGLHGYEVKDTPQRPWALVEDEVITGLEYPLSVEIQPMGDRIQLRAACDGSLMSASQLRLLLSHHDSEVMVPLCMDRTPLTLAAILGIFKAGCVYVPVDPDAPAERKRLILEETSSSFVICARATFGVIKASASAGTKVIVIDSSETQAEVQAFSPNNLGLSIASQHLAYVIFTSGTTGRPKGCLIGHGNLYSALEAFRSSIRVDASSRFLQFASLSFDVSLAEIFIPWMAGATVVQTPQNEALADLEDTINSLKITHAVFTPTVAAFVSPQNVQELEYLVCGGEKLTQAVIDSWGPTGKLFNAYGPSEATIGVSLKAVSKTDRPANIGRVFENVYACVVGVNSVQLEVLPRGAVGELCLGGSQIASAYLNRPDLTAVKFVTQPLAYSRTPSKLYRTGDLARMLENGEIEILGRTDKQVKINGIRIELDEITSVVCKAYPSVRDSAAIVAQPDKALRDQIVVFVSFGEEYDDTDNLRMFREPIVQILRACHERLPRVMVPAWIIPIKSIPRSLSNKVDEAALLEEFTKIDREGREFLSKIYDESRLDKSESFSGQRWNTVLEGVRRILSKASGVLEKDILPSSTIFHLGLDSITAVKLSADFKEAGMIVSISEILTLQSLERIAAKTENDDIPYLQVVLKEFNDFWKCEDEIDVEVPDRSFIESRLIAEKESQSISLQRPPIRFTLIEFRKCSLLLLTIHHALYDGWSLPLLAKEIDATYITPEYEPEKSPSMIDFLHFNFKTGGNGVLSYSGHRTFWSPRLSTAVPTYFPSEGEIQSNMEATMGSRVLVVVRNPISNFESVQEHYRASGISMQSALAAAWMKLQRKYVDSPVQTLGVYYSGRISDAEYGEFGLLNGPCLSILPVIVTDLSRNLLELSRDIQEQILEFRHPAAQAPLHKISQWAGYPGRPLFNVCLNFLKFPSTGREEGEEGIFEPFNVSSLLQ